MENCANIVCTSCGLPLSDAALGVCGDINFPCSSGTEYHDFWCNIPGMQMICRTSELRPLFCCKANSKLLPAVEYCKQLCRHDISKVEFNSGSVQGAACAHGMDCDNEQGNVEVCGNGKLQDNVKHCNPEGDDPYHDKKVLESDLTVQQVAEVFGAEVMPLRKLESHANSCETLKIPCVHPECGTLVKKADLPEHLEKTCKCRRVNCRFCERQINLNRLKLHHEMECPAYPAVSERCSKDGIPRAKSLKRQDSLVSDCDGVQGPPFSQIGCSKTENEGEQDDKGEGEGEGGDKNGAQAPGSNNEERELCGQGNIDNGSPALLIDKLKRQLIESLGRQNEPSEVQQILTVLDHHLSVSPNGNRDVRKEPSSSNVGIISSEKDTAAGTSSSPETSCRVPNMTYVKTLESRLANLEKKVAQQDSRNQCLEKKVSQNDSLLRENICFRQCLLDELSRRHKAIVQLQGDFHKLKAEHELLKGSFIRAHAKITRLQEQIIQTNQEIAVLQRATEFNKHRNEALRRRLDDMNEKVTAYVSLVCGVDIQSVG